MLKLSSFTSRIHFTITFSRLTNKSFGSNWRKDRYFIVEIISTWLKEYTEMLNIYSIHLFPVTFNIWCWTKGRTCEKLLREKESNFSHVARRSHKHVFLSFVVILREITLLILNFVSHIVTKSSHICCFSFTADYVSSSSVYRQFVEFGFVIIICLIFLLCLIFNA
jgi:hypothetical protein